MKKTAISCIADNLRSSSLAITGFSAILGLAWAACVWLEVNYVAVIGIAVFLGIGWAIFVWRLPSQNIQPKICILDSAGLPLRAMLIGPGPVRISTDDGGIAFVPRKWLGQTISVRDPQSLLEMDSVVLQADPIGTINIVIKEMPNP